MHSSIGNLTDFRRVKITPFCRMEVIVDNLHILSGTEVDESIPHIALVLEINWQVKEVDSARNDFMQTTL